VNATEPQSDAPMTMEQAIEAMTQSEAPAEEVVSEETEAEQPEEDAVEEVEEEDETEEGEEVESEDEESDEEDEVEDDDIDDENEDSDESEESDADPDETIHTLKVDGEEIQVSLAELKRGYSGQKFIQKGMQENAQLKKQAEQAFVTLTQERQQLQNLIQQVQQGALTPPAAPNPAEYRDDPFGWHEAQMAYSEKLVAYNQQAEQVTQQLQKQTEADIEMRKSYAKAEAAELVNKMPELADPKKAEVFYGKVVEAAKQFGYQPEEISQISSHRDMMVLHAAMKWFETQKGDSKKIVAEKSKKARKPIKAGTKKTVSKKQVVKRKQDKLRRSGSIQDAIDLIYSPN
jgi:hypothetical protein